MSINEYMQKATNTATVEGTKREYLNQEQTEKYMTMIIEKSNFLSQVSSIQVGSIDGMLPIMNITERNWRGAKEASYTPSEDGKIKVGFDGIPYNLEKIIADGQISNDFFLFNKEKEAFEAKFLNEVAKQHTLDLTDLMVNGDKNSKSPFYRCKDGIIKQLQEKLAKFAPDQLIDFEQKFNDDLFYDLVEAVPQKYFDDSYRWICSGRTKTKLMRYLKERQTNAGDIALLGKIGELTPLNINFEIVPTFPNDVIILGNPKEFYLVYRDHMRYKKTTEGKELVSRDMRYYVWFYYLDFVIKNPHSMAMGINIGDVVKPQQPEKPQDPQEPQESKKKNSR